MADGKGEQHGRRREGEGRGVADFTPCHLVFLPDHSDDREQKGVKRVVGGPERV